MYKLLDIENWNRKEHYNFFSQCDEPLFGITTEIECTLAYHFCKKMQLSFFLYYHYKSIDAINKLDEFRYRILDGKVVVYDTIHVTTTIGRADRTFAFAFIPFTKNFSEFSFQAQLEINRIRNSTGLGLNENTARLDVMHYSTIPWISFKSITHARNYQYRDSIPKITFGKYFERDKRIFMPVSINVHHGLMDAFHVGQHLQLFEQLMNEKSI